MHNFQEMLNIIQVGSLTFFFYLIVLFQKPCSIGNMGNPKQSFHQKDCVNKLLHLEVASKFFC